MSQTDASIEQPETISFTTFLESSHPNKPVKIQNFWRVFKTNYGNYKRIVTDPIRIFCRNETCEGIRTFRCEENIDVPYSKSNGNDFVSYTCGDCRKSTKLFALSFSLFENGFGEVYKYGEIPKFGVPVSNRLLRIFGSDAGIFLKGRSCEVQGLGIGAFSYYRRMVEKHRHELFDEIIKVSETISATPTLIENLKRAREEISFSKAMDEIKPAIPDGLLINGHNPLQLLHSALSVGLHAGTDEECLEAAQDVRLVLTDLVERISQLKKDDAALNSAVQRLAKRGSNGSRQ